MCRLSWFLDPGGWSKTAAVGLYFIFPGICTLSLGIGTAIRDEGTAGSKGGTSGEENSGKKAGSGVASQTQRTQDVKIPVVVFLSLSQFLFWTAITHGVAVEFPGLLLCYADLPLEVIRKKFPKSIIYHYMDDILLAYSNADTLERLFEEVKKILPYWGLQIAPEKIQKGDSINYLGYKIGLQKIRPQKVQIRRDRLRTLNDFQRLFGDISHLRTITGVKNDELSNLFKTLEGDKDLNSPRELTPEAEKELALVEKKVQDGHVDRVDPKLDCILVILPSRHSPTGILMQREDIILKWIFLPNKQSKKLKTYVEKISDLILKGKLRLRQLAGIDPTEIVVPLTKEDIEKLWAESEPWQRAKDNHTATYISRESSK
ncbi:hypothetical protein STEG23_030322 [Scotinomys teguina]